MVVVTNGEGYILHAVLTRSGVFYLDKEKLMKNEESKERFKLLAKEYLRTLSLSDLRCYGRVLNMRKPTAMSKTPLIEEIISVLCGEQTPSRNGRRGAPIKCNMFLAEIPERIELLRKTAYGEIIEIGQEVKGKDERKQKVLSKISTLIDGFSYEQKEEIYSFFERFPIKDE